MAIAFGAAGSPSGNAGATSRTFGLPAGFGAGDLAIGMCASKNNASHTWDGSWTKLTQANSGASMTASIGWLVGDGTDVNPTVSWTGSAACLGIIWSWTGALALPIGVYASNSGNSGTHSITGITTSAPNSAAIYVDVVNLTGTNLATPTNYTEDYEADAAGAGMHDGTGHQLIGTPQAADNISITGGNGTWLMFLIEVMSTDPSYPMAKKFGGIPYAPGRRGVW